MKINNMINIQSEILLSEYTTFRIGGPARYFVTVNNLIEAKEAIVWAREKQLPILVLGRGANMLGSDQGFSGLVIKNEIAGKELVDEDENSVSLMVGAGEDWPELVAYTVSQGWGGLENLAAIPGTVGAAPVQNIGAYGSEFKDYCLMVKYLDIQDPELIPQELPARDCAFAYRDSCFKRAGQGRYLITQVVFSLDKVFQSKVEYGTLRDYLADSELNQQNIYQAIVEIRGSKLPDPKVLPSAGSFFKNVELEKAEFAEVLVKFPEIKYFISGEKIKIPAAWLIEQCGFKGFREGEVGTHTSQPLVLVNYGGANQEQILAFAQQIIDKVKDKFGLNLEPEVNLIK